MERNHPNKAKLDVGDKVVLKFTKKNEPLIVVSKEDTGFMSRYADEPQGKPFFAYYSSLDEILEKAQPVEEQDDYSDDSETEVDAEPVSKNSDDYQVYHRGDYIQWTENGETKTGYVSGHAWDAGKPGTKRPADTIVTLVEGEYQRQKAVTKHLRPDTDEITVLEKAPAKLNAEQFVKDIYRYRLDVTPENVQLRMVEEGFDEPPSIGEILKWKKEVQQKRDVVPAPKEKPKPQQEEPKKTAKPLGVIDQTQALPKVAYKETKTQIAATFTPIKRHWDREEPKPITWVFRKGKNNKGEYTSDLLLPKGVSVGDINDKMGIEFYQEGVMAPELISTFDMMNGKQEEKAAPVDYETVKTFVMGQEKLEFEDLKTQFQLDSWTAGAFIQRLEKDGIIGHFRTGMPYDVLKQQEEKAPEKEPEIEGIKKGDTIYIMHFGQEIPVKVLNILTNQKPMELLIQDYTHPKLVGTRQILAPDVKRRIQAGTIKLESSDQSFPAIDKIARDIVSFDGPIPERLKQYMSRLGMIPHIGGGFTNAWKMLDYGQEKNKKKLDQLQQYVSRIRKEQEENAPAPNTPKFKAGDHIRNIQTGVERVVETVNEFGGTTVKGDDGKLYAINTRDWEINASAPHDEFVKQNKERLKKLKAFKEELRPLVKENKWKSADEFLKDTDNSIEEMQTQYGVKDKQELDDIIKQLNNPYQEGDKIRWNGGVWTVEGVTTDVLLRVYRKVAAGIEKRGVYIDQDKVELVEEEKAPSENTNSNKQEPQHLLEDRKYFSLSPNATDIEAVRKAKPARILLSMPRWENKDLQTELIDVIGYTPEIILDNGAFTYANTGEYIGLLDIHDTAVNNSLNYKQMAEQILDEVGYLDKDSSGRTKIHNFIEFWQKNKDLVSHVISFDSRSAAGDAVAASQFVYNVFKEIGMNPIPVYPYGADESVIDWYVKRGADYIALGNSVGKPNRTQWAHQIVHKYPKIRFHMLGTMDKKLMDAVPQLYSLDGSGWVNKDKGNTRDEKVQKSADKIKDVLGTKSYEGKPMTFKGFHGTTNANYAGIEKEGFKAVGDDNRQYHDNLFGNDGLYMAQNLDDPTWFDGAAARMPVYDKILQVEGRFEKPIVLHNDSELQELLNDLGIDRAILLDRKTGELKKRGYDAIVVDVDRKFTHDNYYKSQGWNPNDSSNDFPLGSPEWKAGQDRYGAWEQYLKDNHVYEVMELQSQVFAFYPEKMKVTGVVGGKVPSMMDEIMSDSPSELDDFDIDAPKNDLFKTAVNEAQALMKKHRLIKMETQPLAGVNTIEDLIFQAEFAVDSIEGGDTYNDDLDELRDEGKTEKQIAKMQKDAIEALKKFISKYRPSEQRQPKPAPKETAFDYKKYYNELPRETQIQLDDVVSDGAKLDSMEELIKEVEWSIERMNMDLGDMTDADIEAYEIPKQIKQAQAFLKKYKGKAPAPKAPETKQDPITQKYDKIRNSKPMSRLDKLAKNAEKYLNDNKDRMNSLPLDLYAAAAIVGAKKMADGVVDFAEWSEQMMNEYGKKLRLSLKSLYTQSQEMTTWDDPDWDEYLESTGTEFLDAEIEEAPAEKTDEELLQELADEISQLPQTGDKIERYTMDDIDFNRFNKPKAQYISELEGDMPFLPDFIRRDQPVQTSWFEDVKGGKYGTFREKNGKWVNPMPAEQLLKVLVPFDVTNPEHMKLARGEKEDKRVLYDTQRSDLSENMLVAFTDGTGREQVGFIDHFDENGQVLLANEKGKVFSLPLDVNRIRIVGEDENVPPRYRKKQEELRRKANTGYWVTDKQPWETRSAKDFNFTADEAQLFKLLPKGAHPAFLKSILGPMEDPRPAFDVYVANRVKFGLPVEYDSKEFQDRYKELGAFDMNEARREYLGWGRGLTEDGTLIQVTMDVNGDVTVVYDPNSKKASEKMPYGEFDKRVEADEFQFGTYGPVWLDDPAPFLKKLKEREGANLVSNPNNTGSVPGGTPAGNVQGTQKDGTPETVSSKGGTKSGGGTGPADLGEREQSTAGQGVSSERAGTNGEIPDSPRNADGKPIPVDHVITGNIYESGKKTRFNNNIAALKLLKVLQEESRQATAEEKEVLAKYQGWGGLPEYFDKAKDEYKELAQYIDDLFTEQEYADMRKSTNTSFYTNYEIASEMYRFLEEAGFKGGRVLEPSVGTGMFIGSMPEEMKKNTKFITTERDRITYLITKYLYPKQVHYHSAFEKKSFAHNSFDVVIGNVPFGENIPVVDMDYKDKAATKTRAAIKMAWVTRKVHNYFLVRSMDLLRPGGIGVLITATNTMDNSDEVNSNTRKYLMEHADMLEVVRLPNAAFKDAGTDVATDIIFFRKKDPDKIQMGIKPADIKSSILYQGAKQSSDDEGRINKYFVENPDQVAGDIEADTDRWGKKKLRYVANNFASKFKKALSKVLSGFKNAFVPIVKDDTIIQVENAIEEDWATYEKGIHDGAVHEREGKFVQYTYGKWVPFYVKDEHQALVRGALSVRDTAIELRRLERDKNKKSSELAPIREKLNRQYDAFVKAHGHFNQAKVLDPLQKDVATLVALRALEHKEGKNWEKIDFFYKRMQFPDISIDVKGSIENALSVSLANRGEIDLFLISDLMKSDVDNVINELDEKNLVYFDPEKADYVPADEYLSGDIYQKLQFVQGRPEYQKQQAALEEILPTRLTTDQVVDGIRFGQQWIPVQVYQDFLRDKLNIMEPKVSFNTNTASWTVDSDSDHYNRWGSHENTVTYGLDDHILISPRGSKTSHAKWSAADIIEVMMNQRSLKASIKEENLRSFQKLEVERERLTNVLRRKGDQLLQEFRNYIRSSPELSKQMTDLYNNKFNSYVLRTYDGEKFYGGQQFPGLIPEYKLMKHQKDAVVRTLQQQNALYAHVVGAGKTLEMQVSIMEGRRLGIIRKPVLVVPSFMLEQHTREFKHAYPNANIKVLGTGTGEGDIAKVQKDSEKNRMLRYKSLADVMYKDYDVVIMTYESFERIPMSPEFEEEFLRREVDKLRTALEENESGSFTVKQIEAAIERLETRIANAKKTDFKDVAIPFEEIGFDAVFVDEAHNFKNLMYSSKMGSIGGLSNSSAKRSLDMYMKTSHMNETGGKTVFATGTPIANSVAEMFTMLRYLAPKKLEEMGMEHFDGWAAQFGTTINSVELNTSGKFVERTRFAEFTNVPELMNMFKDVADVKMADDLPYLKRPEAERETVTATMSDNQKTYLEIMIKRAAAVADGVEPYMDNMLKLTGEGKKLALDYRIIDGKAQNEKESKLNMVAEHVADEYFRTAKGNPVREDMHEKIGKTFDNGTQIVFMDLGVPKADDDSKNKNEDGSDEEGVDTESASMYQNLKDRLIQLGVKENEIAFIHDYSKPDQKKKLSELFNEGKIRVLIGSTGKMGVGMNLQNKLTMLHHADPTWRPADIEQREGRIIRQGNYNPKVKIKTYVTESSFDALMWKTLEGKAKFIAQVMSGDSKVRTMEEIAEQILSYSEISSEATGNEAMKKLISTEKELRNLRYLEAEHNKEQANYANIIKQMPGIIENNKRRLEATKEAEKAAVDISGDDFIAEMDGVVYSKENKPEDVKPSEWNPRKAFREALIEKVKPLLDVEETRETSNFIAKIGGLDLRYEAFFYGFGNSKISKKLSLSFTGSNGNQIEYQSETLNKALENDMNGFMLKISNAIRPLTRHAYSSSGEATITKNEKALKEAQEKGGKPFADAEKLDQMMAEVADLREEARQFELTNSFDTVFQRGRDLYTIVGIDYQAVPSKNKKKQKDEKPDYVTSVYAAKVVETKENVEYLDENDQYRTVNVFKVENPIEMRDIDFIRDFERRADIVGITETTFANRIREIERIREENAERERQEAENALTLANGDKVRVGDEITFEYDGEEVTAPIQKLYPQTDGSPARVEVKWNLSENTTQTTELLTSRQGVRKAGNKNETAEPEQAAPQQQGETPPQNTPPNNGPTERTIKGIPVSVEKTTHPQTGKEIWLVKNLKNIPSSQFESFRGHMHRYGGEYKKKGDPIEQFRMKFLFERDPEPAFDKDPTPPNGGGGVTENTFLPSRQQNNANSFDTDGTVSRSDIINHIRKEFNVPIGTGRYRRRVQGLYKRIFNEIRTKNFADFVVLAHELGHMLENKYDLINAQNQQELIDLAEANLVIPANMSDDEKAMEGAAEFVREYLYNRSAVQGMDFYDEFVEKMTEEGKLEALNQLGAMFDTWTGQSAKARISGVTDVRKKRKKKKKASDYYADWVEELVGLKHATEKLKGDRDLQGKENPYLLAWRTRGTSGKIQAFMEYGVIDEATGQKIAPSFKEILESVPDIENFRYYLEAKHALTLHDEGKYKTPISVNDANALIAELDAESADYAAAADSLYEYQDYVTRELVDSGVLKESSVDEWNDKYPFYVPFYRVMEESGEREGGQSGTRRHQFANSANPVKRMKETGSARNIIDPLESIMKNTFMYLNLAQRNDVGVALTKLLGEDSADIMVEVDPKTKVTTFNLEELEKDILSVLNDAGIDLADTELDLNKMSRIFRPFVAPSMTENIVTVWNGGKQKLYEVRDEELFRALTAMDNETIKDWMKLLAIPNNILRTGITLSPTFIPRGPIRALPTMLMQSDSYTKPSDYLHLLPDLWRGLKGAVKHSVGKEDALFWDWMSAGGAQSTILSIEREYFRDAKNRMLFKPNVSKVLKEAFLTLGTVPAYKFLRHVAQVTDETIRIAEYQQARRKGADRVEAAIKSRDVDVDFSRFGKSTKNINRVSLFFNVALQGPDRFMREIKNHPVRSLMRGSLFITLPTMLLAALNWDDDDYWELEQWERDLFWNIPIGDGKFLKIPIPFEWGFAFKVIPERLFFQSMREDRTAFEGFAKNLATSMVPSLLPTAFVPFLEWMAEKDFSNWRNTVQPYDNRPPEEQVNDYTTDFAKWLGGVFDVPPTKIDQFAGSLGGTLGNMAISGVSAFVPNPYGEKPTSDRSILERSFVADAADGNTFSTTKFYDKKDELEEEHSRNGIKNKPNDKVRYARDAANYLTQLRHLRTYARTDKTLSGERKGYHIDNINRAIRDMARLGAGQEPLDYANMEYYAKLARENKDAEHED
jgi:N12 class adenine-specific DNA methylase